MQLTFLMMYMTADLKSNMTASSWAIFALRNVLLETKNRRIFKRCFDFPAQFGTSAHTHTGKWGGFNSPI
jgi:hypothetical protein